MTGIRGKRGKVYLLVDRSKCFSSLVRAQLIEVKFLEFLYGISDKMGFLDDFWSWILGWIFGGEVFKRWRLFYYLFLSKIKINNKITRILFIVIFSLKI